jgi:hypothetical protein
MRIEPHASEHTLNGIKFDVIYKTEADNLLLLSVEYCPCQSAASTHSKSIG